MLVSTLFTVFFLFQLSIFFLKISMICCWDRWNFTQLAN